MSWLPRGAASVLLLCAGCSSLIGLDEFRDAPEGSSAGAGGSGGAAGQGGSGAQAGTAQGGSGNTGGDGGSGATGGVVTACTGQPDGQTCTLEGADAGADSGSGDAGADASDAGADAGAGERRICLNEQCVVSRCGDGYADDGRGEACDDKRNGNQTDGCKDDCSFTCVTNEDCVAGLLCVVSQCNQTTHTCGPQSADTCDDQDACTSDSCNSTNGQCSNTLIDSDGDGYSAFSCNASGAHADQGGDCIDNPSVSGSSSVFPGEMTFYTTSHSISGLKPFDYNCDGVEELQYPDTYSEVTCTSGWKSLLGVPIPTCGESADYYIYIFNGDGECILFPPVRTVVQGCR